MDIHLKNFPTLYFTHLPYEYIFELDYKDLFKEINNYYYFMIIFPNTKPDDYDEKGGKSGRTYSRSCVFSALSYRYRVRCSGGQGQRQALP